MSASTWSKTGSAAVSAGGRSPAWCRSAARPSVFSATVLPPVFGPLITSARSSPRSRSIGTAVPGRAADAARRASRTSSETSTGAPFQRAREHAERERQVDRAPSPRPAPPGVGVPRRPRRQLAQDPLDLLALGARRLRLAVVELDDVERLDEQCLPGVRGVVDDPRHAAARARLHSEHRPAAALRDEVLLQVLAQLVRADELLSSSRDALPARRSSRAQLAELGRRVVAEVGAVLLDGAVDRLRDRGEPRVDRRRPARGAAARAASSRAARARSAPEAVSETCRSACGESTPPSAACAACRGRRGSRRAAARRLVQERDRLGRQRLPARDLVGIGRRLELRRERRAVRRRGRAATRSRIAGNSSASRA